MTLSGCVEDCEPTVAGPSGLARWRKESVSPIFLTTMRKFLNMRSDYRFDSVEVE